MKRELKERYVYRGLPALLPRNLMKRELKDLASDHQREAEGQNLMKRELKACSASGRPLTFPS